MAPPSEGCLRSKQVAISVARIQGMPVPIYRQMNPGGTGFLTRDSNHDSSGEKAVQQTTVPPSPALCSTVFIILI